MQNHIDTSTKVFSFFSVHRKREDTKNAIRWEEILFSAR